MTETTEQTLLAPTPDPRALNGLRHGVLSELVPIWERDAYVAHAQAVRASVGATDYLQQRLADRASLALWRLDRVARWEAQDIEADRRRFHDRLGCALSESTPTFGAIPAPVDTLNLRDSLKALAELTGESPTVLLRDPETPELVAADLDRDAQAWEAIRDGTDPATLSPTVAESIGLDFLSALAQTWNVPAGRVARVMLGRKATREEAQLVADWEWQVTPDELAALVVEGQRAAGAGWHHWLLVQQFGASGKAGRVRAIAARVPLLYQQELARVTEPDGKRLEKVARYEAHLERVLYRALHELEAMTRDDAPAPVRGVVELVSPLPAPELP